MAQNALALILTTATGHVDIDLKWLISELLSIIMLSVTARDAIRTASLTLHRATSLLSFESLSTGVSTITLVVMLIMLTLIIATVLIVLVLASLRWCVDVVLLLLLLLMLFLRVVRLCIDWTSLSLGLGSTDPPLRVMFPRRRGRHDVLSTIVV